MTELRLTFASEGLAAVSQVLIDMGISFRVEPVALARSREEAAPAGEPAPAAKRRVPAKSTRKTASKAKRTTRPEKPSAEETAAQGAERLRAAIARSGTGYRSPLEPPASSDRPATPAGGAPASEPADDRTGD